MKYLRKVMVGLALAGWSAAAEPLKQVPAGHPRLLGGAHDFAVLRERAKADPLVAAGVKAVRVQADWSLKRPPLQRKLEGFRLLGVCRDALARISSQAMAYRLTDDRRYLEAARKVALDACAFEDWNPKHFLDVSEMSLAVALAYDWLYADLSSEDRETLAAGLKRHGFDEFVKDAARPRGSRMRASNNWGQVCSCGAIATALALWEREGAAASALLEKAVDCLRVPMRVYAPKGAYPEGPGYWAYGTDFNVIAIGLLQHACGTDFGLSGIEGFKATAYFRDWTTGPSGQMFNFSDSGLKRSLSTAAWWFAANGEPACVDFFERPALLGVRSARDVPRTFACALFWMLDQKPATETRRPLVWESGDETGLVAMRSDWTANAWFAAFKGGLVGANHGHLDVGSFVFDAYGLRWAGDMGPEGYHHIESKGIELWSRKQDSERWRLYRLANASHNVVNPGTALQNVGKSGKVVYAKEADGTCTAAFDLDAIYAPTIGGWKRRATLKDGLFTIEDEILGANGVSVPWGFATQASASVEGREVRLTQKGRTLVVRAEAPAEAVWTVGPAEGSHSADSKNPSWTRVTLTAPAAEKIVYRVSFVEPPAGKRLATAKTPDIAREIQDPARLVSVTSTADGTPQPAWFWAPKAEAKKPLLVELHSWSYGCTTDGKPHTVFLDRCRRAGWAFVLPNFRGPNKTPQACGSDLAVQDVMDAVAYAKAQTDVDEDRIYLVGSSGGGMMTLMMAGRHPDVWAACYAACPLTDLARWHAETSSFGDWRSRYARELESSCGGTPAEKAEEYAHRSPLTHLAAARRQGTVVDICEGIHDGHTGSVPVGHSIRAFNLLADEKDRISDADIATFERTEKTPDALAGEWRDPFFGEKLRIHFRRASANVRLTIFEGGHAGNMSAGFEWMGRQRRGRPADWSVAAKGVGAEDVSTK